MFSVQCPRCSEKVRLLFNFNNKCSHCGAHLKPASWRQASRGTIAALVVLVSLFIVMKDHVPSWVLPLFYLMFYSIGVLIHCRMTEWRVATDAEVSRTRRTVIITLVIAFVAGLIAAVGMFLYLSCRF